MKMSEKRYWVIIEQCDSPTLLRYYTKEEILKEENKDDLAIIDGELLKDFYSKFDKGILRSWK